MQASKTGRKQLLWFLKSPCSNEHKHESMQQQNIPVTSAEADVANWRWYVEAMVQT